MLFNKSMMTLSPTYFRHWRGHKNLSDSAFVNNLFLGKIYNQEPTSHTIEQTYIPESVILNIIVQIQDAMTKCYIE